MTRPTARAGMFARLTRLLPLCLALFVAAPALADGAPAANSAAIAAPVTPPVPLLWKVSQPGQPGAVYLLGSFHALRASDYPWAPEVGAALADADEVLFELSPEVMSSPATAQTMLAAALLPAGKTLDAELPAALRARLDAAAAAQGIPQAMLQRLKPWFASVLFTLQGMKALHFDPANGLDQRLAAAALKAGKPTGGLETAAEQIAFLDGTEQTEQVQMLVDALDAVDKPEEMERLHAAWRSGDAAQLDAMGNQPLQTSYPGLYQRILVTRNRNWVREIAARTQANPRVTTLIVVGALHLVGDDGVPAMLAREGLRVERIR